MAKAYPLFCQTTALLPDYDFLYDETNSLWLTLQSLKLQNSAIFIALCIALGYKYNPCVFFRLIGIGKKFMGQQWFVILELKWNNYSFLWKKKSKCQTKQPVVSSPNYASALIARALFCRATSHLSDIDFLFHWIIIPSYRKFQINYPPVDLLDRLADLSISMLCLFFVITHRNSYCTFKAKVPKPCSTNVLLLCKNDDFLALSWKTMTLIDSNIIHRMIFLPIKNFILCHHFKA